MNVRRAPAAAGAPDAQERSLQGELRRFWRALALALSLLLVSIAASAAYSQLVVQPRSVLTTAVVKQLRLLHEGMLDQETSLRAYAATGNPAFLAPYSAGATETNRAEDELIGLVSGDPTETRMVVATILAHRAWASSWAGEGLAVRPGQPMETGKLSAYLARGKTLFDRYRAAQHVAADRAAARRDAALASQRKALLTAGAVNVLVVAGIFVVGVRRRRQLGTVIDAPVRALLDMMSRMEAGELGVQAPGLGPSEFRRLGEGLSSMARRIEAQQARGMVREEAASQLAARLRVILRVARETAGSLDPRLVAEYVAAAAVELGRTRAVVWERRADGEFVAIRRSTDPSGALPPAGLVAPPAVAMAAAEARSVTQGTMTCFPLVVRGAVVGVMEVEAEAWDDEDTAQVDSVLEALALSAASALEAARLHASVTEQARLDGLTGLRNRRSLEEEAAHEWSRSRRYDRPLSVCMIDLDHFKRINDTAGHAIGDEWLRRTADAVAAGLRGSDLAYRYGGEELVVMLPETSADAAMIVAERMRAAIEAVVGPAEYPHVTASVGVATLSYAMRDVNELLAAADTALYAAKTAGRNRVVAAEQSVLLTPSGSRAG
ncbi:sensor domain-containing diguanylate cyclase [Motilibacter deserti]|uniref:Diguanylate cyclase n=1 Tax=Motilibacter deserti TaxID=2714956 RepID=A0ABX0GXF4_9ACTN|nr:diguanylate cyclase [Motilibacter deserti]